MADLIRIAERVFLILLSTLVIVRLWPSLPTHPQLLLFLVSELVGVVIILIQRRGTWTTDPWPVLVAFMGTGVGLLVQPEGKAYVPEIVSVSLVFIGAIISLLAKLNLNRSFGLVPANRGVKTGGVYRLVRHPMYLGYMINQLGFFMVYTSPVNFAIYAVAWTCFWIRAREEEKFLMTDPAYQEYASRVRSRLIPGLV